METAINLKWKRPESVEYPKLWHNFKVKNINTNEVEEYRIQDLPESRTDEALDFIIQHYCKDEPICAAYNIFNDEVAIKDLSSMWKSVIEQKAVLVCFKNGSDEMVGINMNYVVEKDDHFMESVRRHNKSENNNRMYDAFLLLYDNFDTFEHYGVDKYLSAAGLAVSPAYRGRGFGLEFLKIRKSFCNDFGIKLTSTIFTSTFSNRIADEAGFKLDQIISYDDIRAKHPHLKLPHVNSDVITLKSMKF